MCVCAGERRDCEHASSDGRQIGENISIRVCRVCEERPWETSISLGPTAVPPQAEGTAWDGCLSGAGGGDLRA